MYNSKLILILSKLDAKNFKLSKQYLSNYLPNSNKIAYKFLKILEKEYPKFDGEIIEKEALGKLLFPDKKDKVQQVRYLFSDFTKILERFLIENEYKRDPYYQHFFLAKAYRRLELGKLQAASIKNVVKITKKNEKRDSAHFHRMFNISEEIYKHHKKLNPELSRVNLLQDKMDNLDAFYLIEKIKCICDVINNGNVTKVDYETELFDEITKYLKNRNLEKYPALNIYYCTLQTLMDNDEYFEPLKKLLKENVKLFSKYEIEEIYTYARNFCIRKINNNQLEYVNETFQLYKDLLETELIFNDEFHLGEYDFKNIIVLACKQNELEWANVFIEEYKSKLEPQNRLNAYTFSKAYLSFFAKNYNDTITYLQQVQFTNTYYHTDTKVLLVKSYYELDEIVPLYSLLESFKVLLSRNKNITDRYKAAYLSFIKIVKKLIRKKLGSKMNLDKIKQEMKTMGQVPELLWLMEKIDILKAKDNKET